jgi:hypothetical protein
VKPLKRFKVLNRSAQALRHRVMNTLDEGMPVPGFLMPPLRGWSWVAQTVLV